MDRLLETVRTNKEKRDKLNRELDRSIAAIQATNPKDERLRPENIAAARRAIDEKYKDPKTPKGPSTPLDQSTVTEAKNQLDQLQADYRNAEQNLQAQQRAGLRPPLGWGRNSAGCSSSAATSTIASPSRDWILPASMATARVA
ncbi:TPA: hypothetical protein ACKPYW_005780 [Pseudomonas aeruginosa]